MDMDIVVPGNSQLQWSIIGSDMPSALSLVHFHPQISKSNSEIKMTVAEDGGFADRTTVVGYEVGRAASPVMNI